MADKRKRGGRSSPKDLADLLTSIAALLTPVPIWFLLIRQWGWLGFSIGWFVAPLSAVAAAALVLMWTIPLRPEAMLSLSRRRRRDMHAGDKSLDARLLAVSVVMPVYNAEAYMRHSLPPLMELVRAGNIAEVIVVDDGCSDNSAAYARGLGAKVISSGGRRGPGGARNVAAQLATSEVLWFIDADVVVASDSARFVQAAFSHSGVVAVFGSYDDRPAAANFGSQYKNLVHHYYHQHASTEASTFWSGCGAVKREAFLAVGGFDEEVYKVPSIEDVDLGYRLREAGGKITLDRRLQCTHLKVWSIPELVRTDIFRRALPWARLMIRREGVLDDLNVGTAERMRAAYAGLTVGGLALAAGHIVPSWWLVPLIATNVCANWHIFRLFAARRGLLFGLAGLTFHQVYYLYSSATFTYCWFEHKFSRAHPSSSGIA